MKLKCTILAVLCCSVIALTLQLVGLALKSWMYAPSVEEVVDGKNITFYSLRGLWQSQDKIYKYKIAGDDSVVTADSKYENHKFKAANLENWFDAVRSLEVIGAVVNLGSMFAAILWYFYANKSDYVLTSSTHHLAFISLIVAGILDLLGVTILIGKLEPNLTSWGGALCGFAGTFCIMGAAFIRYWQQEKYE